MFKSKIRDAVISDITRDKYYQVVLSLVLDLTTPNKEEQAETLQKWCKLAHTDYEKLKYVPIKIRLSAYTVSKQLQMRALAYFGVTIKDTQEIFGIKANYKTTAKGKDDFRINNCTEEEMIEVRNTLDRLIHLLWFFRYLKYDENGMVVTDEYKNSRNFIAEMYFKTAIFYYSKRYKQLFPEDLEALPITPLCEFLGYSPLTTKYAYSLLVRHNIFICLGEVRSLLYYALGVSLKDATEMLKYKQPAFHYRRVNHKRKLYTNILVPEDYSIVNGFLKRLYERTKYISFLKGVNNKNE